ncbi:myosin-11 [Lactuca sativa]|uniref:myosin-11 n=1 Tax=Lactuca sativa TaxID=4236 RepID=UPI0022AF2925|nr:myosin-11 [Lactuca sativa]
MMQTELEEANGQEILELQNSLQAMQAKVNVTNALLTMDRESSQEKIDKLSETVEELKTLLESERNLKEEKLSESKQQKLEETEKRANQLQESMNRLEEKLINIELENKVLRQQALLMASQLKSILDLHSTSMQLKVADMEERPQKSLYEKQQEYQDLLIRCITQHLGFSKGRPVAACIIYKCLRQWQSFEVEKTSFFDRIIHTIGQSIEIQGNNNHVLAYWLSNVSTLLLLFMLEQAEANCPAFLFKQKLTVYVEKIYGMIRDNLKKQISSLLKLCIQAPRDFEPEFLNETNDSQDILIDHWQGIQNNLDSFLNILKSYYVPSFLVRKIFTQNFSYINARLFNSVLLRRECTTFSNGEYVKAGLSKLYHWCYKETEEYVGSAWDELKHIRQAVGFLVIHQKPKKTLDEISHVMCPILNRQQLYRISTRYSDDKYVTHSLSPDVIQNMRMLMDSDNSESSSFLLDDDSSIPFSVDDLSKSMDEMNIEDVEPPPLISDNSGFSFLKGRHES